MQLEALGLSDGEPEDPGPPIEEMHDVWNDELGSSRRLNLTEKRRTKYRLLFEEHLEEMDRPVVAFRAILRRVQMSDHHMSDRGYQMPESLFRNPESREAWIERTLSAARAGGTPDAADRQLERKKRRIFERLKDGGG